MAKAIATQATMRRSVDMRNDPEVEVAPVALSRRKPSFASGKPASPPASAVSIRVASAPGFAFFSSMTAACQIRAATVADVPLIHGFIRDLATYEKLLHEVEATEQSLRRDLFPADGSPPAAHVLIAESAGSPAGFALYFFNYSTFLGRPGIYLEDLFVKPEFRGRGIGKALLLHLARLANSRGCGRLEWAVLDWNQPARNFYRSLGAAEMSTWIINRLTGPELAKFA